MNQHKEGSLKIKIDEKRRVKLYRLASQGGWKDLGTGYVFITKQPPYCLSMIDEVSKDFLFKFSLMTKAKFHLQRNTIITWKESNENRDDDLALSFQHIQGVKDIWRMISEIKGKDAEQIQDLNEEISIETLPFIAREIQPTSDAAKLQKLMNKIKLNDCCLIKQLGRILEEEERRMNEEKASYCSLRTSTTSEPVNSAEEKKMTSLAFVFLIVKNIIFIADADLLEKLMNDSLFCIVFGALEYDFESQKAIKHRQFLNETVRFNNIISFKEEKLLEKIQVNYRLAYLRDTVLARYLEMTAFTIVNKIIQANNTDIIQAFLFNKEYIESIINQLLSNDLLIQNKAVMFIIELINCSKDLSQRMANFQEMLFQSGLLQTIEYLLIRHAELDMKRRSDFIKPPPKEDAIRSNILSRSIEIVSDFISFLPSLLKDYLGSTKSTEAETPNSIRDANEDSCLLHALTGMLKHSYGFGIKTQIGELIKLFISASQELDINQDSIIFTNCLNELEAFLSVPVTEIDSIERASRISSKQIILDILSYSLNQLKDHMQYWFIHNSIITKVLFTLRDKSKVLTVSVVKFIKTVIETNNYNYQKTLLLCECFDEVFRLFEANKHKDNLVHSTVMSLFDSLIKSNGNGNNKLIEALFKSYREVIYKKGNERYFADLIKRYELGNDYVDMSRNQSLAFHGLFSKEYTSASKEEEYDEIGGMVMPTEEREANQPNLSSLSFFKDTFVLESNASTELCFLNRKRGNDSV